MYALSAFVKSRWSKTFSTVSAEGAPSTNVSLPSRVSILSGTAIPGGMSAAVFCAWTVGIGLASSKKATASMNADLCLICFLLLSIEIS